MLSISLEYNNKLKAKRPGRYSVTWYLIGIYQAPLDIENHGSVNTRSITINPVYDYVLAPSTKRWALINIIPQHTANSKPKQVNTRITKISQAFYEALVAITTLKASIPVRKSSVSRFNVLRIINIYACMIKGCGNISTMIIYSCISSWNSRVMITYTYIPTYHISYLYLYHIYWLICWSIREPWITDNGGWIGIHCLVVNKPIIYLAAINI